MSKLKKNASLLLLGVVVLFGAFLRLYKLGVVPVGMYIDETAIGVDAFMISQTGKDIHGKSNV